MVVGMDTPAPVERARLLAGPADELHIGVVDEVARPVEPRDPHQGRRLVGDPAEALLAFAQRPFRGALLGHVLDEDDEPAHLSRRIRPRDVVRLNRQTAAGRVLEIGGEKLALPGEGGLDERFAHRPGLFAQQLADRQAEQLCARPLEPVRHRLVHEAVAPVLVDEGDHDGQHVGDGEHAGEIEARRLRGQRPCISERRGALCLQRLTSVGHGEAC